MHIHIYDDNSWSKHSKPAPVYGLECIYMWRVLHYNNYYCVSFCNKNCTLQANTNFVQAQRDENIENMLVVMTKTLNPLWHHTSRYCRCCTKYAEKQLPHFATMITTASLSSETFGYCLPHSHWQWNNKVKVTVGFCSTSLFFYSYSKLHRSGHQQ